ncbi:hypothetical protein ACTOB_004551 [Actinoplanes oblitus]|uniref:Uncharacterized protein n=1 Tax=Actinoplanes oblitus TaxID=3040509 RepID=A0ABY8W405_9ACTN|nr:hypothetical protein [Actinoplanes oblitus]WIM92599.1 hypothetical protein ACTOB_004551 [Actinoplanes oblitus]
MFTTSARRRDAGLLIVAVFLAVAFFVAPLLIGTGRVAGFPRVFAGYWSSGAAAFPPDLQRLVDQQFGGHLVRAVIALLLLAVLVVLAVRVRRFAVPIGAAALGAAVLLIASVQGVVSPFGTLLPVLASGPADAGLAVVLAQARDQLVHGPVSPALAVMLAEYVRWHVVKAVLVGVLAVVLIGLSVRSWRRFRLVGLLTAALAVAALVVVVANVSTVVEPVPPFLLLLRGSW